MLTLRFAPVTPAKSCPPKRVTLRSVWLEAKEEALSRPETQLGRMEHNVGKETECETGAMSSV